MKNSDAKRYVKVFLYGGLGNQIFQFGIALNTFLLGNQKSFMLDFYLEDKFKVTHPSLLDSLFSLEKLNIVKVKKFNFIGFLRLPKLLSGKFFTYFFVNDKNVKNSSSFNQSKNVIFDGYFQESLDQYKFEEIRNSLKKFLNKDLLQKNLIDKKVLIHVRGKDFLNSPHSSICNKDYYIESINRISKKTALKKFCIVTDDVIYAKRLFSELNKFKFEFISSENPLNDFFKIASFKYRILSNSTFCLWASELANNPKDGFIIGPSYFFPGSKRKFKLTNEN